VKPALDLLGCPADTTLLIIHADDLGMCHSVNAATLKALDEGAISSASAMVPCSCFAEVAEYAKSHPEADLGVHLTLTSEWENYRWRPVAERPSCASLVDDTGYFFRRPPAAGWNTDEARLEFSAQIAEARRAGLNPTHIDSHMLAAMTNADLLGAYVELGRQNRIPFLLSGSITSGFEGLVTESDIIVDKVFSLRPGLPPGEWRNYYLRVLGSLAPGLNQLIVHLGYDDPELQAITSGRAFWGAAWRQKDYDTVTSLEFKSAIKAQNIRLIGWRELNSLRQFPADPVT